MDLSKSMYVVCFIVVLILHFQYVVVYEEVASKLFYDLLSTLHHSQAHIDLTTDIDISE